MSAASISSFFFFNIYMYTFVINYDFYFCVLLAAATAQISLGSDVHSWPLCWPLCWRQYRKRTPKVD